MLRSKKSPPELTERAFSCFMGTPSRTRTGKSVKTVVFETTASTNSAIGAWCRAAKLLFPTLLYKPRAVI